MMTESTVNLVINAGTLVAILAFGLRFSHHMGRIEQRVDTLWSVFMKGQK